MIRKIGLSFDAPILIAGGAPWPTKPVIGRLAAEAAVMFADPKRPARC
jgi:hypothetical protein